MKIHGSSLKVNSKLHVVLRKVVNCNTYKKYMNLERIIERSIIVSKKKGEIPEIKE